MPTINNSITTGILQQIENIDWYAITDAMHRQGYTVIPGLLNTAVCNALKEKYNNNHLYRKTVIMERHRFGLGTYKYFDYPLPVVIEQLRAGIYPHLAPIANSWFRVLGIDTQFPATHQELLERCRNNNQQKATPLILKYGPGGFNTLHQDLYGDVYFPMQLVFMLSDPATDFTGGELVLTQQMPRAQSKATVLRPQQGDAVIFTTSFRPEKGAKGYYRVNMKHGVSEVQSGDRYTLGIIFHDALS